LLSHRLQDNDRFARHDVPLGSSWEAIGTGVIRDVRLRTEATRYNKGKK
jgi:hypothetical protein